MDNGIQLQKKERILLSYDKKVSIALLSPLVILTFQFFVLNYFGIMDTSIGYSIQIISKLLVGCIFFYSFLSVLRKNLIIIILIYSITGIVYLLNYITFPVNTIYLNDVFLDIILICLPCFIYSFSITDIKVLELITQKAGMIIYAVAISLGLLIFIGKVSIESYSMSLSYYILLPTIIYLRMYFETYRVKYLFLSALSVLLIIAIGSRGAIMCLGVYIIFYYLINMKKATLKRLIFHIVALLIIFILFIFYKDILLFVYNTLENHGIQSRSIILFLEGGIYLSGREEIYTNIMEQIILNPLFGIGIAGDRVYLNGLYSHNIFLEIISGLGVIFGTLIILLLGLLIIKSLFSKNTKTANYVLVWFSVGFVPLVVSGSYLTDFKFWIFLGVALKSLGFPPIKNTYRQNS